MKKSKRNLAEQRFFGNKKITLYKIITRDKSQNIKLCTINKLNDELIFNRIVSFNKDQLFQMMKNSVSVDMT